MFWTFDSEQYRICTLNRMTVNAFLEAVLLCAYPFQHGVVALMLEKIHMIAPHELGVFNTTLTLSPGNVGVGHSACHDVFIHRIGHERQSGNSDQQGRDHHYGFATPGHFLLSQPHADIS